MAYPNMLFVDGDPDKVYVIVNSEDEELAKRAEGYRVAFEPAEVKPEMVAAQFAEKADAVASDAKAALQAARDEAKALGLAFHHKTGLDTILAAIEKKRLEG